MLDRVQVRALAGTLKDIQRLVPKPLLHCLGGVLRVVVRLEGEPSPPVWGPECSGAGFHQGSLCTLLRSSFPRSWLVSQSLPLKNIPTAWCCHHRASPWGWYWPGAERRLVSSIHDAWHSGQRVQSWFHQTRESCFSLSESPFGAFQQTLSWLSCAFYWGVASVWPLFHKGTMVVWIMMPYWDMRFWTAGVSYRRPVGQNLPAVYLFFVLIFLFVNYIT